MIALTALIAAITIAVLILWQITLIEDEPMLIPVVSTCIALISFVAGMLSGVLQ